MHDVVLFYKFPRMFRSSMASEVTRASGAQKRRLSDLGRCILWPQHSWSIIRATSGEATSTALRLQHHHEGESLVTETLSITSLVDK